MVILGKTVTTEFASPYPAATRNPHDTKRTPGVSSSGSGAAVADFHVPCANGTQTGGSVIGPAAYCGVYGYKGSLDALDRTGIRHCKPSIDTLGLFARSLDDLIALRAVSCNLTASIGQPTGKLRVGICRTQHWDRAEPSMQAAVEMTGELLEEQGVLIRNVELPSEVVQAEPQFDVLTSWEGAQVLEREAREHLETFNPWNRERVEFARTLTRDHYEEAKRKLAEARASLAKLFDEVDVLVTPPRTGEAPIGIEGVRPSPFNAVWTQMYTPCVTLPLFEGPNAMPLAIQVIGKENEDDQTLARAMLIDHALRDALKVVPTGVQPKGRISLEPVATPGS
ncbi:MAG: amidase [Alphaproteobacteria bacterium]|nr:amidase [Alphaproteobacteria bacterium]